MNGAILVPSMVDFEKSTQKTDKIRFDFDSIWNLKISKWYWKFQF